MTDQYEASDAKCCGCWPTHRPEVCGPFYFDPLSCHNSAWQYPTFCPVAAGSVTEDFAAWMCNYLPCNSRHLSRPKNNFETTKYFRGPKSSDSCHVAMRGRIQAEGSPQVDLNPQSSHLWRNTASAVAALTLKASDRWRGEAYRHEAWPTNGR